MARLGLSDSMRSTASLEDTEPLLTATQTHRRRHAKATIEMSSNQETKFQPTLLVLSNPLRVILGSILAVVLLSTGANVLAPPLRTWRSSTSQAEEQFENLERSISLLYRDTERLKTTADRFLQHCQETHVAASTRKEMLQNAAVRTFDNQVKAQTTEHAQVTREVLQYYAEQKQKILETRQRLIKMNISLPMEILVEPVHEVWQEKRKMIQDGGELLESDDTRARGLSDAMKGLVFFAEKTQLQDKRDYQRFGVERILIQTDGHLESNNWQTKVGQSTLHGAIFFYVFVVCASTVYLWNAFSDTRKKEQMEDKWSWSPVPKFVCRLKWLLGSVVVIKDLRTPKNEDVSHP